MSHVVNVIRESACTMPHRKIFREKDIHFRSAFERSKYCFPNEVFETRGLREYDFPYIHCVFFFRILSEYLCRISNNPTRGLG